MKSKKWSGGKIKMLNEVRQLKVGSTIVNEGSIRVGKYHILAIANDNNPNENYLDEVLLKYKVGKCPDYDLVEYIIAKRLSYNAQYDKYEWAYGTYGNSLQELKNYDIVKNYLRNQTHHQEDN